MEQPFTLTDQAAVIPTRSITLCMFRPGTGQVRPPHGLPGLMMDPAWSTMSRSKTGPPGPHDDGRLEACSWYGER